MAKRFRISRLVVQAALALLIGAFPVLAQEAASPSPAPSPSPRYAILIVGDEANAEMFREEKALIAEMTRLLPKHPHAQTLQVYSYHFSKEREKLYCEKALNILREDLLFVGIVELGNRVPRRVVYRLDRIIRAARAAADVLARAEEMLAPEEAATQEPGTPETTSSPEPAAGSPSPAAPQAPGRATAPSSWRIQVGSFSDLKNAQDLVAQLKAKGHESRIDHSNRGGASLFRVYVGNYGNRQEAQAALDRLKADGFERAFVTAPEGGSAGPSPGRSHAG